MAIDMEKINDFVTHRNNWRVPLIDKATAATRRADVAYWHHELIAYDAAMAEFDKFMAGFLNLNLPELREQKKCPGCIDREARFREIMRRLHAGESHPGISMADAVPAIDIAGILADPKKVWSQIDADRRFHVLPSEVADVLKAVRRLLDGADQALISAPSVEPR